MLNLFVVWFLTGLWHGASWNFVLWGLYYFVFLLLEKLFLLKVLKKAKAVRHLYLLLVVSLGWVLFRFRDTQVIGAFFKGMLGLNGNKLYDFESVTQLLSNVVILTVSILASTVFFKNIGNRIRETALKNNAVAAVYAIGRVAAPIILLLVSTAALVGDSYNPFLYFQF